MLLILTMCLLVSMLILFNDNVSWCHCWCQCCKIWPRLLVSMLILFNDHVSWCCCWCRWCMIWPRLLVSMLILLNVYWCCCWCRWCNDLTTSLGVFTSLNVFHFLLVVVFCYWFYNFVFQVSQLLLFFCCDVKFTDKYWCRCLY